VRGGAKPAVVGLVIGVTSRAEVQSLRRPIPTDQPPPGPQKATSVAGQGTRYRRSLPRLISTFVEHSRENRFHGRRPAGRGPGLTGAWQIRDSSQSGTASTECAAAAALVDFAPHDQRRATGVRRQGQYTPGGIYRPVPIFRTGAKKAGPRRVEMPPKGQLQQPACSRRPSKPDRQQGQVTGGTFQATPHRG